MSLTKIPEKCLHFKKKIYTKNFKSKVSLKLNKQILQKFNKKETFLQKKNISKTQLCTYSENKKVKKKYNL